MTDVEQIEALQQRHASLEQLLADEATRPLPNSGTLQELKRQKLAVKEELSALGARTH